jgi:cell division control protein 7
MEKKQVDYLRQFFNVERCIGKGAFGQVLVTSPIQDGPTNPKRYAVKCILPVIRPQRLASELRHLRDLGGKFNVVQLHTAQLHKGSLFIVMELIDHDKFSKIVPEMDHEEIVMYMKNLLIALQHVHSRNIMHRDVKPGNFLYNRQHRKYLLVDFGLATHVRARPKVISNNLFVNMKSPAKLMNFGSPLSNNISAKRSLPNETNESIQMLKKLRVSNNDELREPVKLTVGAYESPVTTNDSSPFVSARHSMNQDNHKFSTPKIPRNIRCFCYGRPKTCASCMSKPEPNAAKSGTPGYKAPETLLRYPYQTTAIDIWSAGVIMFCLLAGHGPLFRDVDDLTSLCEIITLLGSSVVKEAAKQLGVRVTLSPERQGHDLKSICQKIRSMKKDCNPSVSIPDEAFDLLQRMLDPSPFSRITASEALQHPWLSAASI